MLDIRLARKDEFQAVRAFYHHLIDLMQGAEYTPGWEKDVYPENEQLRQAIDCQQLYLGEREGVPRKPDPQIVFDIRAQLPGEARYFGDSLVDCDTAANAEVLFIACSWGFVPRQKLLDAGITRIADRPDDILKCVE